MDEATVAHPARTYKQHKLDATLEKNTKDNRMSWLERKSRIWETEIGIYLNCKLILTLFLSIYNK